MANIGSFLGGLGGGAIGSAVVRLYLDDDQYKTALAGAEASSTQATGGIAGSFQKMKAYGAVAFAALGTAAVSFAASSIASYRESESALAALEAQVGSNTAAYIEMASALQKQTRFSDEAALGAETILARFQLTEDQIRQVLPVLADYAVATGTELPAAAQNIGKALLGNARALKTIGVDFTATGNKAQDFATIVDALSSRVGGAAAADMETFDGRMANLSNTIDELKEAIGAALIPILEDAAQTIEDLLAVVEKASGSLDSATGGTVSFGDAWEFVRQTSGWEVISRYNHAVLEFVGVLDDGTKATEHFDRSVSKGIAHASTAVRSFANKSGKELKDWKQTVRESFDSAIFDMSNMEKQADVTRKEFIKASNAMEARAKELASAMRIISKEKWVNPEYVAFLADQGPAYLIGFTKLNKEQQREAQADWEATTTKTDKANNSLDRIVGAMSKINHTNATGSITIEYKIKGVDPSTLPGLSSGGNTPGGNRP